MTEPQSRDTRTVGEPRVIMDEAGVRSAVVGMAGDLVHHLGVSDPLSLIGIQRRGVDLAHMLGKSIKGMTDHEVPIGTVDITLYRDDLMAIGPVPLVGETELPEGGVDDRSVVLVDDVVYTGRTVRAALNELMDWGRPSRVLLCVLVDRGGRELPIQPDVVGHVMSVVSPARVDVLVPRIDQRLAVVLGSGSAV